MQNLEDAATRLNTDNIQYLVGRPEIDIAPREIFSDLVSDFLDDLARALRGCADALQFPDIQTFAFWIRKANYQRLKERMDTKQERIGRGLVFHIAPSNVPINFAYSLVFGMMSGNVNIVRTSSKSFPQIEIVCKNLNALIKNKYPAFEKQISILKYQANKEMTDYFSKLCHARIIWGGDETIQEIRKSPIMPRTVEMNFADRFSFAVIHPESIVSLDAQQLKKLATDFYHDTYLMDQNACTAPHLILWKKNPNLEKAKERFWQAVYEVAKEKYSLEGVKVIDKFTELYKHIALYPVSAFKKFENYLYVLTLEQLSQTLDQYRGKFGLFYEYDFENYEDIAHKVNEKIQTCAYFGIERKEISDFIFKYQLRGIDRIVPIGNTLNIDLVWDGYDVIGNLSRVIG